MCSIGTCITPLGVRIRTQMEKVGIKAVFQGTSGIVSDAFIEGLGPLAEGVVAFREGAPVEKLPGGKIFMDKYAQQKYNEPPEAYGPFAFAATNLVIDAIEAVGRDRRKVRNELNRTQDHQSIVGTITSGNYGHHLGGAIGLGYVPCAGESEADVLGSAYEIEIAGQRVAAKASLNPMYDPKAERVRVDARSAEVWSGDQ